MPRPESSTDPSAGTSRSPSPGPSADDVLTSPRARLLVLAGLAVIAVGGCFLLWLDVSAKDAAPSASRTIAGAPIAPTERGALDQYLAATPDAEIPKSGWNESEPGRLSQINGRDQWVVDVYQVTNDQWSVVRIDHCTLAAP